MSGPCVNRPCLPPLPLRCKVLPRSGATLTVIHGRVYLYGGQVRVPLGGAIVAGQCGRGVKQGRNQGSGLGVIRNHPGNSTNSGAVWVTEPAPESPWSDLLHGVVSTLIVEVWIWVCREGGSAPSVNMRSYGHLHPHCLPPHTCVTNTGAAVREPLLRYQVPGPGVLAVVRRAGGREQGGRGGGGRGVQVCLGGEGSCEGL